MIQFYAPEIEDNGFLPEGESAHCSRVLRLREGDEIFVTDGRGHRYKCRIREAHPKHTSVDIIEKENTGLEREYKLTLAVAPTKNSERMEWLLEKAVEIGVDKIALIKCSRSERKEQKTDRLRKVMVSAMKQSLSTMLPKLTEVISYDKFIAEAPDGTQKFFGYCSEKIPKKEFVKECRAGSDVIVMIGPEGDFTPEEVEKAIKKGFKAVTFGKKRLRTETAGIFAISAVNTINQLID